MKKWKKLMALMGVCIMTIGMLAGCSNDRGTQSTEEGTSTEQAKGRFVESELSLPEHIQAVNSVARSESGEITMIGYGEDEQQLYLAHSSDDGKTWSETKLETMDCYVAAVNAEDGSAAVFGYENADKMTMVSAKGKTSKVKLTLPKYNKDANETGDPGNFVTSAGYANGKLFVTDLNWDVYEVNPKTGEMTTFSKSITENVNSILTVGSRLALTTDNDIQFADAETGELVKTDTVLEKALGNQSEGVNTNSTQIAMAAGASDDELYYMNHEGLFYHKFGGSTIEQLMDGSLASVSDKSMTFHALMKIDDKNFLLFAVDAQRKERCFQYSYDATISAVPENQLNVYALEDSNVLQQLITAYQKKYPDVMVKKTIGMSGKDGVTAEDAIKTLNTEVLAGNGPDVIILDGLPTDSYIEKGALADISSYVKAADEKEGLFTNITDAYATDGALYQVPTRFYCSAVVGSSDLIANSSDLKALEQYVKQWDSAKGKVCTPLGAETLLYSLYCADSASWKKTTGIDSERLQQYLRTAKALYDADGYSEKERVTDEMARNTMDGQLMSLVSQSAMSSLIGMGQISFGSLTDVGSIQQLYAVEKEQKGAFALLDAGEYRAFVPYVSLGLAKSGAENKNAQAFIKLALSAEGQKQMNEGFSINCTALEKECEGTSSYYIGASYGEKSITLDVKKITKKQKQELVQLLESLDTPSWTDRVVEDLVLSEGKLYLQGKQSMEETVSAITKKVQLYVAE